MAVQLLLNSPKSAGKILAGAPVENTAEHRRDLARPGDTAPELGGDWQVRFVNVIIS